MARITIQAIDGSGSFAAYLVEPKAKPAGVVVLIQEMFGVNQAMRAIAAWVADLGFIAVCPDLFWRIEPGIDITDKSDAEWKRAFDLFQTFTSSSPAMCIPMPTMLLLGSMASIGMGVRQRSRMDEARKHWWWHWRNAQPLTENTT